MGSIDFGNVASNGTATQELLVYNSGPGSSFTITSATAISPFSFTGVSVSNCTGTTTPPTGLPVTLTYLQTCQLNLQYVPTATEFDSGKLQIVDNAAQSNLQNVCTTTGCIQRNVTL